MHIVLGCFLLKLLNRLDHHAIFNLLQDYFLKKLLTGYFIRDILYTVADITTYQHFILLHYSTVAQW